MKYVCSKKYKILCKEDCYHVKNIKEENRVWFDTVAEGLKYGCRPCKHCKPDREDYQFGKMSLKIPKYLPLSQPQNLTQSKFSS